MKARIVGLLAALTAQATRTPRALRGDISKAALAAMANTNRAAYLAPLVAVHIIAEELGQSTPTPEAGGARRRETDGPTGPTSRYSVQCIQCGGARPVPSARRVSALCPACKDTRTTKRRNVDTA